MKREAPLRHAPAPAAPALGRIRADFSGVRVHTDARAAESASAIAARAYTVGRDIVFAASEYAPHTPEGRSLLAHELAHVAQNANEAGSGGVVRRKGGTAGGFLFGLGRGLADLFTGSEPEFDKKDIDEYLAYLRKNKEIEDDFDSDNKAREVVRLNLFKAEDPLIRTLLVQEMMSGFVGDDDEQAILAILEWATVPERNKIAETVGYPELYSAFDGAELDKLYGVLPVMETFRPRTGAQSTSSSMTDYIKKWEKEHGRSMTEEERTVLANGCIGITELNLGTLDEPDLSNCYGNFEAAWAASHKMNEFLAQNHPDRKAIIFSQRFWKLEGEDYTPDPKTSRVDMSKYTMRWRPGDDDFINFDYGFFNEATGKWLHANHCDPVVLGSACDVAGRMIVKESTLEYYSQPLKDFNTQVFCVGISTLK